VLYTAPGNPGLSNLQAQFNAQGRDGSIFTTSEFVGSDGGVFKIAQDGTVTVLNSTIGGYVVSGVTLAQNGNFFGANQNQGIDNCSNFNGCGQIFTITPTGTEKVIYSFTNGVDGADPMAAPVQANNGLLYGTTPSANGDSNASTAYSLSYSGAFTVLHTFNNSTDGSGVVAGLTAGTDGNFYGVAQNGGMNGDGTVFRMTKAGAVTVLHSFAGSDGETPARPLIQASNGIFYGVTPGGGDTGQFGGTVFSITPSGSFKVLHTFTIATDGGVPNASLVEGTDGVLFGVTSTGGKLGGGTIFSIGVDGTFHVRHNFDSGAGAAAGWNPQAPLTQNTNGLFYSTTYQGGACSNSNGCGVVYSFDMNLAPFVRPTSRTGIQGSVVGILGQGFTPATTVEFAGVAATKIAFGGGNFLEATVPPGALSGPITVSTAAVTLTSNPTFLVTPILTSFSPASGPIGASVTITGTGLAQTAAIRFGSKPAMFHVNSDTQVTATVPADAVNAPILLVTKGGRVKSRSAFSVN
jgi:uncharacterized repeat protein (TIGR03803 family)